MRVVRLAGLWLTAAQLLTLAVPAAAEPYLAVRQGLACSACHANPTGAGMRTPFGNVFSQQQLPAVPLPREAASWNGTLGDQFGFGANARWSARQTELDDRDDNLNFGVDRVTVYLGAELGPAYLYVDEQVAPVGSLNREAWALFRQGHWYAKAGRMFLPYGWRLQDDTALVREAVGVNLDGGDDGVEVGFERTGFSWQMAVTNGNGGGAEIDDGKLFSTRAALIRPRWQGGVSALRNDTDLGHRTVAGLFAGIRTGPVSWLAESDYVRDDGRDSPVQEEVAGLLEANLLVASGQNLKLTLEGRFFDDDRDDRYRMSAVYEYFPRAFTELRLGVRSRDSNADDAALNSEEAFLQLHVYF